MAILKGSRSIVIVPVEFQLQGDDGKIETVSFRAHFNRLTRAKSLKVARKVAEVSLAIRNNSVKIESSESDDDEGLAKLFDINDQLSDELTGIKLSDLVGWDGVLDVDGEDVPYSEMEKENLLDNIIYREAILEAWDYSSGRAKELALKN